jgi:serpin B
VKVILGIFLSLLALGVRGEVAPETLARDYNHFGFELLMQARLDSPQANLFLSPSGLAFALSMVQNGAGGETLKQMATVMHVEGIAPADLNAANKALLDHLGSLDPKIKLEIANGIWTDKKAVIEPEFASANKSAFNAAVFSADFRDPGFVKTINDWASDHTDGKITRMIEPPLDPSLRLIVMDAIYFKGTWLNQFDPKETRDRPFTLAGGESVKHPRMARAGKFAYREDEKFQAIELPYAGNDVSMVVMLPKGNLDEFLRTLTAENFERWTGFMETRRGSLELPRFKLENEYDLKPILKAMGMTLAFTPGADFKGISSEPLAIDWVKQKTYVDVNEEGTEAAAVTGVGVRSMVVRKEPPPFRMIVDRPFVVALREKKTGILLFLGVILDPR